MDKLSIIVPVYREGTALQERLLQLQPMRARGHELILVNGDGDDDGPARCAALVDKILVSPRGRARQMNAGASLATGEVLLFLHADTRLPDSAADSILTGLASGQRCWGRFDVRLSNTRPLFVLIALMMNLRSRLTGICTGDQALFVSRDVFWQLGGFPDQPLMEDIALTAMLRKQSRPLCLRPPVVTSSRRWEQHGPWRTIVLMRRLRLAYFFGASPEVLHDRYYLSESVGTHDTTTDDR